MAAQRPARGGVARVCGDLVARSASGEERRKSSGSSSSVVKPSTRKPLASGAQQSRPIPSRRTDSSTSRCFGPSSRLSDSWHDVTGATMRALDQLAGMVRESGPADLSSRSRCIAPRLLDRRRAVEVVDLEQVDVVDAEAEAGSPRGRRGSSPAGCPSARRARRRAVPHLVNRRTSSRLPSSARRTISSARPQP